MIRPRPPLSPDEAATTLRPEPAPPHASASAAPWPSMLLLRGGQEVSIEHKGAIYRLRLTRQDKLILTK